MPLRAAGSPPRCGSSRPSHVLIPRRDRVWQVHRWRIDGLRKRLTSDVRLER